MSAPKAQLVLASDRRRIAVLDPSEPLTIGRASGNKLTLTSLEGVSDHHAVVRHSRQQGWLVCDWQSEDGTFLEGQQVRQCRRLDDGDEIRLGSRGPVLVFQLAERKAQPPSAPARSAGSIEIGEQRVPVGMIRACNVQSLPMHPHIFSWWLLGCLGGLLLLPFPWLFWPLELGALACWIVLGSRKAHRLVLELQDGRAMRHSFQNRRTALVHRNGIRKAIGQELQQR